MRRGCRGQGFDYALQLHDSRGCRKPLTLGGGEVILSYVRDKMDAIELSIDAPDLTAGKS